MKIVIIGAGVAGLIAAGAFSRDKENEICILDPKGAPLLSDHKALMRLRDDNIKNYLNCKLKKITVQKAVYHNGKLYTVPNILLNNLYSLKVYSSLGDRSLSTLGSVDRYLIKEIDIEQIKMLINKETVSSVKDFIVHTNASGTELVGEYQYDCCISTIPMPTILQLVDCEKLDYARKINFAFSEIHVLTAELDFDSTVNQTIYFTHQSPNVPYRATIEGRKFIVESISPISRIGMNECTVAFGISHSSLTNVNEYVQPMGKIMPIDDFVRRRVMVDLTHNYKIYSFGRFSTWRPLRIDQIFDDLEKIRMLIKISNKKYYE